MRRRRYRDEPTDEILEEGSRRNKRRPRERRRSRWGLRLLVVLVILLVAAPTILSHTRLPIDWLASAARGKGWQLSVDSVRIGWLSPIQLTGVRAQGASKQTRLEAASIETELSLLTLLRRPSDLGSIRIVEPRGTIAVLPGSTSLERDLESLMGSEQADDQPFVGGGESSSYAMKIEVIDGQWQLVDAVTDRSWMLEGLQGSIAYSAAQDHPLEGALESRVVSPSGSEGTLRSVIQTAADGDWNLQLDLDQLSLDILDLACLRSGVTDNQSYKWQGLASGKASIRGQSPMHLSFEPLAFRDVRVMEPTKNGLLELARLDELKLQGKATYADGLLAGDPLEFESNVGRGRLVGTLQSTTDQPSTNAVGPPSTSAKGDRAQASQGWAQWLDRWSGEGEVEIDLAALAAAAPRALRLRENATVRSGHASFQVARKANRADSPLEVQLQLDSIAAATPAGALQLAPIDGAIRVRPQGNMVIAEQLKLTSSFANLDGHGDMQSGEVRFDIDLAKLAEVIAPLVDLSGTQLTGKANGQLAWMATPDRRWQANGDAIARDLRIVTPTQTLINEPSLKLLAKASGSIENDQLTELTTATLRLQQADMEWQMSLVEPIAMPDADTAWPVEGSGSGELGTIVRLLRPWLPESIEKIEGKFSGRLAGVFGQRDGALREANFELTNPRGRCFGRNWSQPQGRIEIAGKIPYPQGDIVLEKLQVQANVLSLAARGRWPIDGRGSIESAFSIDTDGLQRAIGPIYLSGTDPDDGYWMGGMIEGTLAADRADRVVQLDMKLDGKNATLFGPRSAPNSQSNAAIPIANANAVRPNVIWSESMAALEGIVQWDLERGRFQSDRLTLNLPWGELSGKTVGSIDPAFQLQIEGSSNVDAAELAARIRQLAGIDVQLRGESEQPLRISIDNRQRADEPMVVETKIAWEEGTYAGMNFGKAIVPIRLTDRDVRIERTELPLDLGTVRIGGNVRYSPEPLTVELAAGQVFEQVAITEPMCRSWLKYVAPLAADATSAEGTMGLVIDEAIIVPNDPIQTRVIGRLQIDSARLGPGPLSQRVLGAAKQIKAVGRGDTSGLAGLLQVPGLLPGQMPVGNAGNNAANNAAGLDANGNPNPNLNPNAAPLDPWLLLPAQTVDFQVDRGMVTHNRIEFQADDMRFFTSGAVGLDSRLNMLVQVPIQAKWVERVPQLAGQTLSLPIDGTLSQPSLDSRQLTAALGQVGAQAVQGAAENLLQRELQKGLEKTGLDRFLGGQ
jgi:translocation and assembly module TamB